MKTRFFQRTLCLLLALITIVSMAVPVFAASNGLEDTDKEKIPSQSSISIRGYGYKTSGTIKNYTDSTLKKRGTAWIDLRTDECWIKKIANGGKALYIKFPVGGGKYLTRWFSTKEFLGVDSIGGKLPVYNVEKMTTYKRSNGGGTYGYTGDGDKVYVINTNSKYVTVIYPLSGGYKIGNIKLSTFQKYAEPIGQEPSTSSSFVHPMKNYHKNYTQWGVKASYRSGSSRKYHVGVDYMSNSNRNIYAFADGTVVKSGWNNANGNFILIEHRINDANGKAKTVYSFYGHLSKYTVSKGDKVSAGDKIGKVGQTGSGGNGIDHLHFAIIDYKWTSGGVYGYVTKFSGDKVKYDGVTYYNPYYVIKKGRLP